MGEPTQEREDALIRELEELKRRVAALESRLGGRPEELPPAAPVPLPAGHAPAHELAEAAGMIPLIGWALLGIAGAYLLRAFSESGALAGLAGVTIGIAYAAGWLVLSARRLANGPFANALYALTATLILMPLVWETTVRFELISARTAGLILALFVAFGLAIAWRGNLSAVAWMATLGAIVTSAALLLGTYDAPAGVFTVLLVAALVEFSACRDHWLSVRWIAALAADLAVLFFTALVTRAGGLPEAYVPFPAVWVPVAQVSLLAIYLGSTLVRTLWRGLDIGGLEIAQTVAAYVLCVGGALRLAGIAPAAGLFAGVFSLVGGAACYVVAFSFLDRRDRKNRNFYAYATFALLLVTAGSAALLSGAALAAVWSILGVAAAWAGISADRKTLRIHGALYLLLSAFASHEFGLAGGWIFGGKPDAESGAGLPITVLGAALCYVLMARYERRTGVGWTERVTALVASTLAVWGALGILAQVASDLPEAATVRTLLLTTTALALAACGRKWDLRELVWLVLPVMLVAGSKLLAEDFRRGRSAALFVSLIVYGGALILLPRLLRPKAPAPAAVDPNDAG